MSPRPIPQTRDPVPADEEAARLQRVLSRAVRRVCPAELSAQREDMVQNAVLRILEQQRTQGEQQAPRPASYLWRVAYTTALDELRRVQRRREVKAGDDDLLERAGPTPRPELRLALRGCMECLSPQRREAVALYLHGFTAEEGAKVAGWSVKRVQNLIFRGLHDLRRCLESKGLTP